MSLTAAIGLIVLVLAVACAHRLKSTADGALSAQQLAQLWMEPGNRDLFYGPGGRRLAPRPNVTYKYLRDKTSGAFSPGYHVRDPAGREWSTKLGPESQAEVAASRLIWAVGYHQPPIYLLREWNMEGGERPNPQGPARFRPSLPDWREKGTWSWNENPFVDTRQFRGLIVLMVMLNNSDLKADNNTVYERPGRRGSGRLYVVRDVGHSFGRTGKLEGTRSDVEDFNAHGFIERVEGDRVVFEYHGFHGELLRDITVHDVEWICQRLTRLSRRQWHDAFRAAAYPPDTADAFIKRMGQKIRQGLEVRRGASRDRVDAMPVNALTLFSVLTR